MCENLSTLNSLLKTNSGVVYLNHVLATDVPLAISLVRSQLTNAQRFLGPVGMKHYDLKRGHLKAVGLRSLKLFNIQAVPVVTVSDTVNYGDKRRSMIDDLKMETEKSFRKPGTVYGIAPEGTRNKGKGTLQRANRGMGYLEPYDSSAYYLPLALMHPKFSEEPEIKIGEPLRLSDIIPPGVQLSSEYKSRAQEIADIHMYRLAELMPPHLRGVYSE